MVLYRLIVQGEIHSKNGSVILESMCTKWTEPHPSIVSFPWTQRRSIFVEKKRCSIARIFSSFLVLRQNYKGTESWWEQQDRARDHNDSLPKVTEPVGPAMVRIVSKNMFFEIKISQRHDWETPTLSYYDISDRVKSSFFRCKHDQWFFQAVYPNNSVKLKNVWFDFFRLPVISQAIPNF